MHSPGAPYVAPYVTGWIRDLTGDFAYATVVIAVVMLAGVAILLTVGRQIEQAATAEVQP